MHTHTPAGAGMAFIAVLIALLLAPIVFKFLPVGTKGLI
jgi:hypothetical protein